MVLKIKKNYIFHKYVVILHYHCLSKKEAGDPQNVSENFSAEIPNYLRLYEEHT